MHHIAQGWLVYSLTKSAFYLGMVGMVMSLPMLFFTLIGGLLADRFRKRNIMMTTQFVSIFPVLALSILTHMDSIHIWQIMVIAFLLGTINAIDVPTRQSFLVEMVGRGNLLNAIALNSTAFNGARMIGPIIAGFIIDRFGVTTCFYINAFSYIPVIFVLSKMALKGDSSIRPSKGVLRDFMAGVSFIKKKKKIAGIILTVAVFSLFGIPFGQFLPVFAESIFHAGAKGLGFLVSAMGFGSLLAGIIIAFKGNIERKRLYMSITGFCFSLSLLLFPFIEKFSFALFLLILVGWSVVSFLATANSYIQLKSHDEIRGRVMSVYSMMFLGMMPLGYYIIGTFADFIGIREMIFISAIICFSGFIALKRKWGD